MPTIDAHAHVFPRIRGRIGAGPVVGLRYGRAAVGEGFVQVLPPLNARVVHSPSMLVAAMDLVGVDRAVLLQGPFYGYCNAYVNAAATCFRDRFAAAIATDPGRTVDKDSRRHAHSRSRQRPSSLSSQSEQAFQDSTRTRS